MEEAYSKGRNETSAILNILNTSMEGAARDETSGTTIDGGDVEAVSSPKQMMEEDPSKGRQDDMNSVEGVREKPHEQWRDDDEEAFKLTQWQPSHSVCCILDQSERAEDLPTDDLHDQVDAGEGDLRS